MFNIKTLIIAVVSVAAIAIANSASAHGGGMGYGGGWGHHGPGWHHMDGYSSKYGDRMSKEDYQQFEQRRAAFLKETESLRTELIEKQSALQDELAKESPDVSKASALQKEISALQAQFDQKRIENMVEMRKANPNAGSGYRRGGPMMGYGGGYCW